MIFDLDFNEYLRVMSCILIILLILQGLDYVFGFGVNNYVFIIFCILFAFTMGSIYYNVLLSHQKKLSDDFNNMVHDVLVEIKDNGLTEDNIDVLEDILLNHKDDNRK